MAWRLDEAVEHGMIDNTVEGTTTGKIWLAGRDEPLILSLNGDCWRDLAGTVLEFENPQPQVCSEANSLDTEQNGIVGDITASQKARVPQISEEQITEYYRQNREIPCEWKNILYLEWFSEINGRVLIEAPDYRMRISEHVWEMDQDLEEAQKLANMNSMRDFLAQMIRRSESDDATETPKPKNPRGELNEFEWEERLKESDRLTDAYQEVLEKYIDDPDAERKEAFVMGWDGLLGAMADREESDDFDDEDFDEKDGDWNSVTGDEDFYHDGRSRDDDELDYTHPLQVHAQQISLRAFEILGSDCENDEGPSYELTSSLLRISTKLAGVLNDRSSGYQPEAGFVLAVLKRCLNWINEAVGACQQLIEGEKNLDQIAALEQLRADIFSIRDGILEIRRSLKQR
ncbi:MAG: hypothetical protein V4727_00230 [Verrucomicrobiota bacterium]